MYVPLNVARGLVTFDGEWVDTGRVGVADGTRVRTSARTGGNPDAGRRLAYGSASAGEYFVIVGQVLLPLAPQVPPLAPE